MRAYRLYLQNGKNKEVNIILYIKLIIYLHKIIALCHKQTIYRSKY